MFEIFRGLSKTVRYVSASNDGGRWVFHIGGEPQTFENLAAYEAKKVRARFTPEMLDEYLRALGIRASSESFYTVSSSTPAYLVENTGPPALGDQYREYSLEDVRAEF